MVPSQLYLTVATLLVFVTIGNAENGHREAKLFSLINIINFQNGPCPGSGNKNGTCYTELECSEKGGTKAGTCAGGYGVCCVFSATCGQSSNQNCTYFESNAANAGACRLKICKCDSNICQLRLDFNTFMINGPSTSAVTIGKATFGVIAVGAGKEVVEATKCLTDSFSVTNPGGSAPPTICGTNTGEHMYVDASDACNELSFQLGSIGSTGSISNRQWSIKVTQYACDYDNLAPQGCTQYFFDGNAGTVRTYNYQGGSHLADQRQQICFRQERGNCRICYTTKADTDFSVSGKTDLDKAKTKSSVCCGYGMDGMNTIGYDCLVIPGAEKSVAPSTMLKGIHFCGRQFASKEDGDITTVCTKQRPFYITFVSDSFEFAMEVKAGDPTKMTKGFELIYTQSSC